MRRVVRREPYRGHWRALARGRRVPARQLPVDMLVRRPKVCRLAGRVHVVGVQRVGVRVVGMVGVVMAGGHHGLE